MTRACVESTRPRRAISWGRVDSNIFPLIGFWNPVCFKRGGFKTDDTQSTLTQLPGGERFALPDMRTRKLDQGALFPVARKFPLAGPDIHALCESLPKI